MAKDSLNLCRREGKGKTRCAQTVPLSFSSLQQKFKAPSRARVKHPISCQRATSSYSRSPGFAVYNHSPRRSHQRAVGLAFDFPALDGALDFCCEEDKEGRLFERSEFASSPSSRQKSKEGVAISGAPFFCLLFFGKTKKSESVPAGNDRGMDHQQKEPVVHTVTSSHPVPNSAPAHSP